MNEIRRVLRRAAGRLFVIDLIRTLVIMLSVVVGGLVLALVAQRVFGFAVDWAPVVYIASGVAAAAAMGWSLIARAREMAVARRLDERAELRETLSTALAVERSSDPWAKAVVEAARNKAVGVDVRRALPIEAPRFWPVPFALALSLVIIYYALPTIDVMGLFARRQESDRKREEIRQVKAETKKDEEKLKEMLAKANVEVKPEAPDKAGEKAPEPQSPEEIRRAAVRKLTSMQDKLNELKSGEKNQKAEAVREAMKRLKQPGPGPMDEMVRAMQRGEFEKAQEKLDELAKKLAADNMPEAEKKQLQQQLEKMGEQLQKLASDKKELEEKLQQAGMSKQDAQKAAADPEELKKALEQLKNMTPEQRKQLMQQAMSQAQTSKQCEGMSQSMAKMAQGMKAGKMDAGAMEGMQQLGAQLSEMEMLDQEMKNLDKAMGECKSQMAKLGGQCQGEGDGQCTGQGPWKAGQGKGKSNASGGPGQGNHISPQAEEAPTAITQEKSNTKLKAGPIIASRLVAGASPKGESVAEYSEVVEASANQATEAMETMQVSRELQPAVKTYFGRLAAKSKAQPGVVPETPKPAESGK